MPMIPSMGNEPTVVPFFITNATLGGLTFEYNPSEYDPFPLLDSTVTPVISGTPSISTSNAIYDNRIVTLRFPYLSLNGYTQLKAYTNLNAWGQLTQSQFTDGNIGFFNAANVKVLSVFGQPARNELDGSGVVYHDVTMELIRDV